VIGFIGRGLIALLRCLSDNVLRALARALFSRSWKQFLDLTARPREEQTKRLLLLLQRSKDTVFGLEHGFADIRSVEEFQAKVPILKYEDFDPYIQRMLLGEQNVLIPDHPRFFARSSGTTGAPKYIPITDIYLSEFRRPRRVWMRQVMQVFPGLIRGKILTVHSPKIEGHTPGGIPYGSITVAMSKAKETSDMPVDVLNMEAVPRPVFLIEDFQTKYYVILRFALQEKISLAAAINPSTLVLLGDKLREFACRLVEDLRSGGLDCSDKIEDEIVALIRPKLRKSEDVADVLERALATTNGVRPTDVWPQLQGLLCWKGGSAPFYLKQLEHLYPGCRAMDFGYLATEGGFSIVLSEKGSRGVVAVGGHFLEFLPLDESGEPDYASPCLADELAQDTCYRVLVTGAHGLYRYDINDVVRCVGRYQNTAEIEFVHKGGNMLSVTGEKLGEAHVVRAFSSASASLEIPIVGFCVSVEYHQTPRYVFGVEFASCVSDSLAQQALKYCEFALQGANIEYAAKRGSLRLAAPKLCVLKTGAFEKERARRVANGAPENHVKPRHILAQIQDLEALGVESNHEWRDE
jgi:hypothetical protein